MVARMPRDTAAHLDGLAALEAGGLAAELNLSEGKRVGIVSERVALDSRSSPRRGRVERAPASYRIGLFFSRDAVRERAPDPQMRRRARERDGPRDRGDAPTSRRTLREGVVAAKAAISMR